MDELFFTGGLFYPMDAINLQFSPPKLHTHAHAATFYVFVTFNKLRPTIASLDWEKS